MNQPLGRNHQVWIPTFDYLAKDASVSAGRSPISCDYFFTPGIVCNQHVILLGS
jgi:hypothetical protein